MKVGDPRDADTLIGPLIDEAAFEGMKKVLGDGIERVDAVAGGFYVRPAIVEVEAQAGTVLQETFAPILYVLRYRELDEAIALNNAVPQGLSSSIFTNDLREAERFMSAAGLGLRHRQRQYRPVGRRDRRRIRRREGNRRRARKRVGQLARLHAAPDQHHQLWLRVAARAGHPVRHRSIKQALRRRSSPASAAEFLAPRLELGRSSGGEMR